MDYWSKRNIEAQRNFSELNVQQVNRKLVKYFSNAQKKIIGQFEEVYNKVLLSIEDGRKPTPADLYKLDAYWKGQIQLRDALIKLGNLEAELLSESFIKQYQKIYESTAVPSAAAFSTIDTDMAAQIIKHVWAADGKSWDQRIWDNNALLAETLEEEMVNALIANRPSKELRAILQDRFNVSYHRAETLVRTEIAHITTQAAQDRYIDAGIKEVEVWADKDERRCEYCGTLHRKRYPVGGKMPIPAHPNCRCCLLPVVDLD